MKYAIKIRSIIWRKISIYSVQGLPVGSNNVGFDVIGASPDIVAQLSRQKSKIFIMN